jgi:hypothetical protein
MTENSRDSEAERDWAVRHFGAYLLHSVDDDEAERMHAALASMPDLNDELDEYESGMIQDGLAGRLAGSQHGDFERHYVNGGVDNRIRLKLEQCLTEARSRKPAELLRFPRLVPGIRTAASIAAMAAIVATGWLWEQNRRARIEIAGLRAERDTTSKEFKLPPEPFVLAAGSSGSRLIVNLGPGRLVWRPVPDAQASYRIGLRGADGREETSAVLTPRDSEIGFDVAGAAELPLPWRVSILKDGKEIAYYTLAAQ